MAKKITDLTTTWCSLFAYDGRELSADQFALTAPMSPFIEAGWLVPAAHTATVLCEHCDEAHWVDVEFIDQTLKGVCQRSGEAFTISCSKSLYRVNGDAFASALASALEIDGNPRRVRGLEAVWSLGVRRLGDVRVAFFCTPTLGRIDLATTIVAAVADQSRSTAHCLLVGEEVDAIRLLQRNGKVVRLHDIATIQLTGKVIVDTAQLVAVNFPDSNQAKRNGRPSVQRDRILQLLDELPNSGPIADSNESLRDLSLKYRSMFMTKAPAPSTFRVAIKIWNARRGFGAGPRNSSA